MTNHKGCKLKTDELIKYELEDLNDKNFLSKVFLRKSSIMKDIERQLVK